MEADARWRARPVLAFGLRALLLLVPLAASFAVVLLVGRLLPVSASRSWWGVALLLVLAFGVAQLFSRATRRFLPLAVLLKLTMLFPDRAPSRYAVARGAARTPSPDALIWTGAGATPTSAASTVLSLVAQLGAHDRRTRGHSERVRVLCDVLASELELDTDARDRLRWASLLHDVGKVGVSPRVLNKPSSLDAGEFAAIKEHPEAGAALVAPLLPWLGEWGLGIVDHHERFDGTGYPAGKRGAEISYAGRLVSVVDAFETMTAHRPYKRAMATRKAREELARCAGTHFDPVMVRAFLAVSLPRVLWTMGPLSFVLQLPFLRTLADAGAYTGAVSGQVAVGAGGAAALATAGAAVVGATVTGALPPPSSPAVTTLTTGSSTTEVVTAVPAPPKSGRTARVPVSPLPVSASPVNPSPISPGPATAQAISPQSTPARTPTPGPSTTSPAPRPASPAPALPTTPTSPSPSPAAKVDRATTITASPPARTSASDVLFEMTSPVGWDFSCRLSRSGDKKPTWSACRSPAGYSDLQAGDYVFAVRSVDTDGREGRPTSYAFEILASGKNAAPAPDPGRPGTRTR